MRFIRFLLTAISIFLFFWLAYWATDTFFEPKAYNHMVKTFTATKHGSNDIVLIVIDDKSVGRYRWPWKRNLYCKILDYFNDYTNCKLLISDSVVVNKDDPVTDSMYFNSIKRFKNIIVGMTMFGRKYENEAFGEAYDKKFKNKFDMGISDLRLKPNDFKLNSLVIFPDEYFNAIKYAGSIKLAKGDDDYVRVAINAINYKGTIYPSLALRAYMYLHGNEKISVTDRHILSEHSALRIPLTREKTGMYTFIRYYKPNSQGSAYTHKTYSAIDIMDSYDEIKSGKKPIIDPKEFDGKIVMFGANVKSSLAGLSDVKRSPVSGDHSGLDIQATILDNYLNNHFMIELADFQNIFIAIVLMVLTFLIIRNLSLFAAISSITVLLLLYLTFCAFLYRKGFAINTITPISMSIITMIFAYSHKYILEDKNKEKIKTAMGKYISVKNADTMLNGQVADVSPKGTLILSTPDGQKEVYIGDVLYE